MQYATPQFSEMDETALLDPLHYAMASRDGDVMTLVGDALSAERARLAFHPIVTAGAEPRVAFYEGLVRLMDDAGRIIPAAHFMPLVEQTGFGRQIDCITLSLALKMLQQNPEIRLSVNLSARSIGDGAWRRTLDRGLRDNDGLGDRLIFEISETSAMMLHENVIRFMAEMQPKGVAFALDGFGAGMTAFRYLKEFFFDLVKIDKSFIKGIQSDPDNQVLTEALVTVAHQFEMFAIADGVETEEEATYLREIGVDCLQGYLYGVPKFTL
ncbi:EAL domain-containing protein [Yoonia sediminilitoris]|uniref:EAL domain-containing protein (Putative c-di-GMP-specific phosphodiesterase class I) n=1 Tax=Yoonia sediminilitoris TaxID=1286148 RepID=A0A2T6KIQ0_9RHOB|nr:EAL domain-containing protein [Yoonia sediminilitoris]PUB15593.1 EAL domain-containing protein (putative c-di-GMP-specific phosphodiesterase class I) [Yoonia sediminilitoris]RCW96202.1 EAL domain-containing protein (putative c-di-GMP-specific phosphodiesterase class I) [Yoonia sediminilitoris]